MKTRFFSIVIMFIGLFAYGQSPADFSVSKEGPNTIGIWAYRGTEKDVVIPKEIDGRMVVRINGFRSKGLTSVVIPDSVTYIENIAFSGNHLTSIVIPNSVTRIGGDAFSDNQLTSVVIPDGVTTIGWGAFSGNPLTSVVIPSSVTSLDYRSGGSGAFDAEFMFYYNGRAKKAAGTYINNGRGWVLQGAVQSPEDFEVVQNTDGKSLTITKYNGLVNDVIIPAELYGLPVTAIGREAFVETAIRDVVIPDGVVSIAYNAFKNNRLTSVDIPNIVIEIGNYAFVGNQLTQLTLGNGLSTIGREAFANNQLTGVVIPNKVTEIGWDAFANNQLTSVIIPNSVIIIGDHAFYNNQLTSITLGSGLVALRADAFSGNRLTSISIAKDVPEGRVTIGRQSINQSGISTAAGFEEGFVNYYKGKNRTPGIYVKNGPIWSKK